MTASGEIEGPIKIKVQFFCGEEIAIGPGKADLLEAIARDGSISAAGRALGISYRRAWLLVDTMNRCWDAPLVETALGGKRGGGARLTELGAAVLTDYRLVQGTIRAATNCKSASALRSALRPAQRAAQDSK